MPFRDAETPPALGRKFGMTIRRKLVNMAVVEIQILD
jgi:hypothetical protein